MENMTDHPGISILVISERAEDMGSDKMDSFIFLRVRIARGCPTASHSNNILEQ